MPTLSGAQAYLLSIYMYIYVTVNMGLLLQTRNMVTERAPLDIP